MKYAAQRPPDNAPLRWTGAAERFPVVRMVVGAAPRAVNGVT